MAKLKTDTEKKVETPVEEVVQTATSVEEQSPSEEQPETESAKDKGPTQDREPEKPKEPEKDEKPVQDKEPEKAKEPVQVIETPAQEQKRAATGKTEIPEYVTRILKAFSTYKELYIDIHGGAFAPDSPANVRGNATLYKNPYFKA